MNIRTLCSFLRVLFTINIAQAYFREYFHYTRRIFENIGLFPNTQIPRMATEPSPWMKCALKYPSQHTLIAIFVPGTRFVRVSFTRRGDVCRCVNLRTTTDAVRDSVHIWEGPGCAARLQNMTRRVKVLGMRECARGMHLPTFF